MFQYQVSWEFLGNNSVVYNETQTDRKAVLNLQKYEFLTDNYEFKLKVVNIDDKKVFTEKIIQITIEDSPLSILIKGGNR